VSVLRLRRGSTRKHARFTGAEGEITVDTDKHTVVVHDGRTPGGFPLELEGGGGGGGSGVTDGDKGDVVVSGSGSVWTVQNQQPLDGTLTALAGLNATAGLVEQTGADAFTKRALGVAASTSVLTRADGDARYDPIGVNRLSSWLWPPFFATGAGGTKNYGDGAAGAIYFGRLPVPLSSATVQLRYRTTTAYVAGSGGTPWAEVGVATGTPGASPALTAVAYADASASDTTGFAGSLEIKQTAITGVTLSAGADIWVLFSWKLGASLGTGAVFRGLSVADDLNVGVYATRASYRPSTNIGSPQTFTAEAFNLAPAWCALGLP